MEIDQDYLRTGTAIGSRASHESHEHFLLSIILAGTCRVGTMESPTWVEPTVAYIMQKFWALLDRTILDN